LSKASNETEYPKRRNDLTRKSFKTWSKNQRLLKKQ